MRLTLGEAMGYHKKLYEMIRDMPNYDIYVGRYFADVCSDVVDQILGKGNYKIYYSCFLCEYASGKLQKHEYRLDRCRYCPVFDDINTCNEYKAYCQVKDIFKAHACPTNNLCCTSFSISETLEIKECCDKISKLKPRMEGWGNV